MKASDVSSLSRRQWLGSGLAACGYLAAGGLVLARAEEAPAPKAYTPPTGLTNLHPAPGLETRLVSEHPNGEKTYALIFAKGDGIMAGLTEFAVSEDLVAGHFSAIGALEHARFGWFDSARKAYRDIPVNEQVEMISLIGDLGLVNGSPAIHAHGAVAFRTDTSGVGISSKPSHGRHWSCSSPPIPRRSSKNGMMRQASICST